MKTALTVWGKWISPVFDSAQTLLIVEIEGKTIVNKQLVPIDSENPAALAKMLKKQNVSLLICGAISEYPARVLENEALELIPFISGDADKVLDALVHGHSIEPVFLMPGCRRGNLMRNKTRNGGNPPGRRCCRKHFQEKDS